MISVISPHFTFSTTTSKETTERYQQVQRLHWLDLDSNMQISTGLPRPDPLALHALEALEVAMQGEYRLLQSVVGSNPTSLFFLWKKELSWV